MGYRTGISRFVVDELSKLIGNRMNTRCMIKEKER